MERGEQEPRIDWVTERWQQLGSEAVEVSNHRTKILIAEDEHAVRETLAALLEAKGFAVVTASDGDEALAAVAEEKPDLVLLDVLMPRCDGYEVCRAIKSRPETRLLPVVLVTGLQEVSDRVQGLECGADDILTKPVHSAVLLARIRSLLRLKRFVDDLESAETVLCSLALSIEAKDPYTEGHCERLSKYSEALGRRLGLPEEQCQALRRGGFLHDIGKVAVPEWILLKPEPLTPEERRILERHPVVGERICAPLKSFRHTLPIIRHHHERLDGGGYPDGLEGDQIPITAQILQLVDIYDALTSSRPYRGGLAPAQAIRLLHLEVQRGWRDGRLLDEMAAMLRETS